MFRHLQEEPSVERRQASAPAAEGRRKPISPWRAPHPLVRTVSPASVGVPLPSLFFRSVLLIRHFSHLSLPGIAVRRTASLRSPMTRQSMRQRNLIGVADEAKQSARQHGPQVKPGGDEESAWLHPPPCKGGGGPRSCAVEGASDSSLYWRRKKCVESDTPSTILLRKMVPLPSYRGAG